MGLDPAESPIPVLPTAHYAMGGVPTDLDGRVLRDEKGSAFEGLYAAGECACVSVHGANRLGCNSLLDTVVFGRRAGIAIGGFLRGAERNEVNKVHLERVQSGLSDLLHRKGDERPSLIKAEIRKAMMEKCSVFRHEEGLRSLAVQLKTLKERAEKTSIKDHGKKFNTELLETVELYHLLTLSEVITLSALQRTESRGAHFRDDFPKRDDADWLKHTLAFKLDAGITFRFKPVTITRFQPEERKY
jgi:succinate dehydrogenase / fumarate reductase flavoprotein subunit